MEIKEKKKTTNMIPFALPLTYYCYKDGTQKSASLHSLLIPISFSEVGKKRGLPSPWHITVVRTEKDGWAVQNQHNFKNQHNFSMKTKEEVKRWRRKKAIEGWRNKPSGRRIQMSRVDEVSCYWAFDACTDEARPENKETKEGNWRGELISVDSFSVLMIMWSGTRAQLKLPDDDQEMLQAKDEGSWR